MGYCNENGFDDSLLFFFLLLIVMFCNCGKFGCGSSNPCDTHC